MDRNLVPRSGILLYPFLVNLMPIVTTNAVLWNIDNAAITALQAAVSPFTAAWETFINPNSGKVDRDNMLAALKITRLAIASFARSYLLYNPLISAAQRIEMGFGPKPKPVPGWQEAPILSIVHKPSQIIIRFKGKNAARWGKAIGANHLEMHGTFSETRPLSLEDYTFTRDANKSPLLLPCTEEQRRTRIWIWTRWVANAGNTGDWSQMIPAYFS